MGRSYSYTAIWPVNGSSWPLDRRFLLKETFISKYTSDIARECHEKLTDRDNSPYYKPEMKSLEPGQTDGQSVTLSHMRWGLLKERERWKQEGKVGLHVLSRGSGVVWEDLVDISNGLMTKIEKAWFFIRGCGYETRLEVVVINPMKQSTIVFQCSTLAMLIITPWACVKG